MCVFVVEIAECLQLHGLEVHCIVEVTNANFLAILLMRSKHCTHYREGSELFFTSERFLQSAVYGIACDTQNLI